MCIQKQMDDILKMSVVSTIQLVCSKLGREAIFDYLWSLPVTELYSKQAILIKEYNFRKGI